ncbi:hypothetical protein BLOT_016736 [Blomia tropicalis]|nr:hypothetical protein BLOT_016736 [Blomia tropicalis]
MYCCNWPVLVHPIMFLNIGNLNSNSCKELMEQLIVKDNLNYQGVPSTPHPLPLQSGIFPPRFSQ